MEDKLRNAYDGVTASALLKQRTKAHIRRRTLDYGRDLLRLRRRRQRMAGCLVCLALAAAGLGLWNIPTAIIGLDVNPSVELQVNGLDRVIRLRGCNADGDALAACFDVAGLAYDDAMQRLLISDEMAPYLENGSTFLITVSGSENDHTQQMLNKVVCRAYALAEEEKVLCIQADGATARAASRAGLSVARYQAWQRMLQDDPQLPPEAALELTTAQIRELIDCEHLNNPCGE